MKEENLREIKVTSEEVYSGKLLHIYKDTVKLPNGHVSVRELMRHSGAVCVVPVNEKGEVAMERQFRYPYDEVITEIPAGKLEKTDTDRVEGAKRELLEETGITADKWTDLGPYYPAAAYSDEYITMYLAEGLHMGERHLDEDEFLNVEMIPLKDLIDMIMDGKIPDGKTQAALLKAARLLGV